MIVDSFVMTVIVVLLAVVLLIGPYLWHFHDSNAPSIVAQANVASEGTVIERTRSTQVRSEQVQHVLNEYQAEVLYSTRSNILQVHEHFYRCLLDGGVMATRFSLTNADLCKTSNLLNLYEVAQNDRVNITALYPDFYPHQTSQYKISVEPSRLDPSLSSKKGEVLIVYTTCNQLAMTMLSLQYLRNTDKIADIIVIDDHSTDGTVEYLQKKGFAVISKPKPTGLTDSWNIGYRIAVALGYKHVLFTNNDVLLTAGAVHLMHYGLKAHSLVVPLTTDKGSGHHKQQVRLLLCLMCGANF